MNFPKQIRNSSTKKEIPIKSEKQNSKMVKETCNFCYEVKCVCEKKKDERPSLRK